MFEECATECLGNRAQRLVQAVRQVGLGLHLAVAPEVGNGDAHQAARIQIVPHLPCRQSSPAEALAYQRQLGILSVDPAGEGGQNAE